MKNLTAISRSMRSSLKFLFASNVIKQRATISSFPSVNKFFHSKASNEEADSIEVIVVSGDLYRGEEYVYGAFFSGSEDTTNLRVKDGSSFQPFSVSTDTPMIVIGNLDKLTLETTLIHELYHFVVPENNQEVEYSEDPEEMGARNFERKFLTEYYGMPEEKAESFMERKYLN